MARKPDAPSDPGLAVLLELHGEVFVMDNRYWTRIEAWQVEASAEIPHGIRYNLTLHDHHNQRVLGYDNAHAVQGRRRRFQGRRVEWDHRHENEEVAPYDFDSAAALLEDFWADVDRIIKSSKR